MKTHEMSTSINADNRFKLGIGNESHTISKEKPKIRIIHIVAPQIIKTDVQHFRELVQKLTGNPDKETSTTTKKKKKEEEEIKLVLQKKKENPNKLLSFLGEVEGFMHGINEFPLIPFRSSTQINSFDDHHISLC